MPQTLSADLYIEEPQFAVAPQFGFLISTTSFRDDGENGISFWRFVVINERCVKVYQRAIPAQYRMYYNCIYRVSYNN